MKLKRGLNRIRFFAQSWPFSQLRYTNMQFFVRVVQFYIRYYMLRYKSLNDYLLYRITKEFIFFSYFAFFVSS